MNNPLLGVGCVCWDLRLSLMSIENRCTFKKSNLSVNIHHAATHALVLKRCLHILSSFTAFCCCCCCCYFCYCCCCCCCYCYWETCLIFFSISFSDDIDEQEQLERFQCLHMMSFSLNFKNEFEESKKYLHVPIQFSTGFFVTNDLSIGSTETKYIKLKPKIFLLCK